MSENLEMWDKVKHIKITRSIDNIEEGCLTFCKTENHLKKLIDSVFSVHVIVPFHIDRAVCELLPKNINVYILKETEDLKRVFIQLHNKINENKQPEENIISSTSIIDPTAVIGVPGNNIIKMSDGRIINMKHMGNVIIEDNVEVQALSVVHRAVFTSTILRKNCQIFAKVNIGHNCDIGESTIICPGSLIAGGTKIGKNCYIWQGVITRSNINICDNVIVGAGSLVLKDIDKSGVYVGSPAKYIKEYREELR
jgi:UDP-3-O-[3-hydroxymyristoyl] glucosamine N-acyltransferase